MSVNIDSLCTVPARNRSDKETHSVGICCEMMVERQILYVSVVTEREKQGNKK